MSEWRVGERLLSSSYCHGQYKRVFRHVVALSLAYHLTNSGLTPTLPHPHAQPPISLAVDSSLKRPPSVIQVRRGGRYKMLVRSVQHR